MCSKPGIAKPVFSAFSFSILNPLPTLFVLIWSGYGLLHYGSFDFIAWVAVLLLGSGMAEAVMPMMMLNNLVAQTRLSIQRIYQVLAMPELSLPQSDQQPQEASITFEQVSFHYPQARTGAALQEVSFHVPAGQLWRWSGQAAPEKAPWRACCCVTPTRTKAISVLAAWICVICRRTP